MKKSTNIIDIVKNSCEISLKSIKLLHRVELFNFKYTELTFAFCVFGQLADILEGDQEYSFTQIYNIFLEIYYREYQKKLMSYFFDVKGGSD